MTKSVGYTDENVTRIEVDSGVSAGIRWGSLSEDMVPIFEEQAVRIKHKYSVTEWLALEPMERALMVAVERIDNAMKNIQAEAEIRGARRKAKTQ